MTRWFDEVPENGSAVVSSRVRLVRNWDQYRFPSRMTSGESEEMVRRLKSGLSDLESLDGKHYEYLDLTRLSGLEKKALRERRVINAAIASKKEPSALVLSEKEDTGIVLNGSDHIRIQIMASGLKLKELWKQADRIDDYVGERFSYAFDEKYGYLTSFPTNMGTGLRASVILHLPALSLGKKFNGLVTEMSRFGASVKGVYGEGSENYGALYQVSNQKTLGISEKEILELVTKVALQLASQEEQVRRMAMEKHSLECADEAYKSYGVLKYARRLSQKDAMTFLSQMMSGVTDGILKFQKPCSLYRIMLGIQPGNLQLGADRPFDKEELDEARAAFVRDELPELI